MSQLTDLKEWGLWTDTSWREFAINGGYVATTAFVMYFIGGTGADYANFSEIPRNFMTLGLGFFIPYTVANFPSLQKMNKLKENNLALYNAILDTVKNLKFEQINSLQAESFLSELKTTIKESAYNCFNVEFPTLEKNSFESILKTNQLLKALLQHANDFISHIVEPNSEIDNTLQEELKFWQQEPIVIKDTLISNQTLIDKQRSFSM